MSAARVGFDLECLSGPRESSAELADVARGNQRIVFAEDAEIGTREVGGGIERAPRLGRVTLLVAEHAVEADAGGETAQGACGEQRVLSAHAEPRDADASSLAGTLTEEIDGGLQIAEHARIGKRCDPRHRFRGACESRRALAAIEI